MQCRKIKLVIQIGLSVNFKVFESQFDKQSYVKVVSFKYTFSKILVHTCSKILVSLASKCQSQTKVFAY